jgi:hypothetical protein
MAFCGAKNFHSVLIARQPLFKFCGRFEKFPDSKAGAVTVFRYP